MPWAWIRAPLNPPTLTTNSLLGNAHLLSHLPTPWHHAWQAGHPGERTSQVGDSKSLKKTAHLCPGPRTEHYPSSQNGRPRTLKRLPAPALTHLPIPCPSAHSTAGLQALPRRDAQPAVAPRARPGLTRPNSLTPIAPHTQPPPHPRSPLPRSPDPRSKTDQLNGAGTHHRLLPSSGPLSPESPGSASCLPCFLSSLPYSHFLFPRSSPKPSPFTLSPPFLT